MLLLSSIPHTGLELDTGLRLFPKHLGIERWRDASYPGRSIRMYKHCPEVGRNGLSEAEWQDWLGTCPPDGSLGTQKSEAHTVCLLAWRMNNIVATLAGILWTWLSAPKSPHLSSLEVRCWDQADTRINLIDI